MTNHAAPTPILDNVAALLLERGPYDGKRGSFWEPTGPVHYTDARCEHRSDVVRSIQFIAMGEATRSGSKYSYTPGLTITVSRWQHGVDGAGSFITVQPPYNHLPETAIKFIRLAVGEVIGDVRSALGFGITEHDDGRFLDAIFHEASRAALAHQIEREEQKLAEMKAKLANLDDAFESGKPWSEYGIR